MTLRDDRLRQAQPCNNSPIPRSPPAPTMPNHNTPAPSLNLKIPSLHDSLPLSARLYLPPAYTRPHRPPTTWARRLAIVAHPYAPLGGSYDDRVVLRLVALLLSLDWVVATFNFRGAPGAVGTTSWTGRAEVADYTSVAAWALAYVQNLPGGDAAVTLLLAGYSYGSLVASRLPGTEGGIVPLLGREGSESEFAVALREARESAKRWWDSHGATRTSYSGERTEVVDGVQVTEAPSLSKQSMRVVSRYLLISPLLPPVSSFLLGFGSGSWVGWAKGMVGMGHHGRHHHDRHGGQGAVDGAGDGGSGGFGIEESGVPVLVVYGDGDTFTGVKKYRRWRERMMGASTSWSGVEVEGAGHFWHEEGVMEELEGAVRMWVGEGLAD